MPKGRDPLLLKALTAPHAPLKPVSVSYRTALGRMLVGKIEDVLDDGRRLSKIRGRVKLLFTSPPFPLIRKKRYGNESRDKYLAWLEALAPRLADLLTPDGSIVIEVGNAWEAGIPVMSTLPLEALLSFKRAANLYLCQHVICHNPARLPSPAQWVTVDRVRLKDSYTHVWWMSPSPEPDADNKRVLTPYSADMKQLLKRRSYNAGRRPSGHVVSRRGFLTDHGGAISSNVVDLDLPNAKLPRSLLKFTGTAWDANYRTYCADRGLETHPARMPIELAAFFIQFLTRGNDLVVDPFAGSNTTGAAAEALGRRWLAVEADSEYAEGSKGRFDGIRSNAMS